MAAIIDDDQAEWNRLVMQPDVPLSEVLRAQCVMVRDVLFDMLGDVTPQGSPESTMKRKRRRPSEIDLSVVADLWRGGSIDAVSEHFCCSDRTASRYVARAREDGLIGADERPAS